ncbi:hypothetical protein GMRT_15237 [Giardia muris]|uniref:Uncharacterized protein n=1 Tax=Giardia muris TaxID=5742 RepID=A0A4Z1T6Q0_GIAMU|nr:hypothetical protein GMRT_15237 [Giardia muris]|eukprot:TNJ28161.1 hypothetical protein GMRT_15237 [Giardia muris]
MTTGTPKRPSDTLAQMLQDSEAPERNNVATRIEAIRARLQRTASHGNSPVHRPTSAPLGATSARAGAYTPTLESQRSVRPEFESGGSIYSPALGYNTDVLPLSPTTIDPTEYRQMQTRILELEQEVLRLTNENEALNNKLAMIYAQGFSRGTAAPVLTGPEEKHGIKGAHDLLDMSTFEKQWRAIEESTKGPTLHAAPRLMSSSRLTSTPSIWHSDMHRKSQVLNRELEEGLDEVARSTTSATSMTTRSRHNPSILAIPNAFTSTNKIALPVPGSLKEAIAPRVIGIDSETPETCLVWRRETPDGLVASGAIALDHICDCLYGETARTFRGWLLSMRRDGNKQPITTLAQEWSSLPPDTRSASLRVGHANSIILISKSRTLCFEILSDVEYKIWIAYLVDVLADEL